MVLGLFESLFLNASTRAWYTGADRAQLARIEKKLDLILNHLGIDFSDTIPDCPLSLQVQELARDPALKINAISLHRQQTGAGLKEAKDAVERFMATGR